MICVARSKGLPNNQNIYPNKEAKKTRKKTEKKQNGYTTTPRKRMQEKKVNLNHINQSCKRGWYNHSYGKIKRVNVRLFLGLWLANRTQNPKKD